MTVLVFDVHERTNGIDMKLHCEIQNAVCYEEHPRCFVILAKEGEEINKYMFAKPEFECRRVLKKRETA